MFLLYFYQGGREYFNTKESVPKVLTFIGLKTYVRTNNYFLQGC